MSVAIPVVWCPENVRVCGQNKLSIDSMAETNLTQMSHLVVVVAILLIVYCHICLEQEADSQICVAEMYLGTRLSWNNMHTGSYCLISCDQGIIVNT